MLTRTMPVWDNSRNLRSRGEARRHEEGPHKTDFKSLDPLRNEANPSQLDLVESFAQGKINRRHFIQRGTVLGLSLASISAIIAA
ncbi:MAG: hypothetical protein ACR2JV_01785, partial [Gaiellales bacterium]